MGNSKRTEVCLDAFLDRNEAGLWVADGNHIVGDIWWGVNRNRASQLLRRRGFEVPSPLGFAAGSMFWAKPDVISAMDRLAIGPADFEPEDGRFDGTTAHAVERVFGAVTTLQQLSIVEASELSCPSRRRWRLPLAS